MTSALPDKEEREMMLHRSRGSGKSSDWIRPRDSVLELCREEQRATMYVRALPAICEGSAGMQGLKVLSLCSTPLVPYKCARAGRHG